MADDPNAGAPLPAWTGADYANAAVDAGQLGTAGYLARAPIAAAAKGALGMVSKVPGVVAVAPRVGLGAAGLLANPIGKVVGGGLGGAFQTFTNPIGPGARDWAADTQANTNAEGLAKLSTGAYALGHGLVNAVKGAGMGVQAAFDGAPPAAPVTPATQTTTNANAALVASKQLADGGQTQGPDPFLQHIAGLSRRDLIELLHTMPAMPHLAPHDQALHAINLMSMNEYNSNLALANAEKDPAKRAARIQAAADQLKTRLEFTTVPGIGTLNPEVSQAH